MLSAVFLDRFGRPVGNPTLRTLDARYVVAGDRLFAPPVRVAHADMVWAPAKMEPYSMIDPARVAAAVRTAMED